MSSKNAKKKLLESNMNGYRADPEVIKTKNGFEVV